MKPFLTLFIMTVVLGAGSAKAVIYGFDDKLDPDGTPLVTCVISGTTVTLRNSGTNPLSLRTYESEEWIAFLGHGAHNKPLDPEQVSYDRFISTVYDPDHTGLFAASQPISFTFSVPIDRFGLTTLDLLENGSGENAHLELTAYDSLGNTLDQHSRRGTQGASGVALEWEVASAGIKYVELTGEEEAGQGGFGIDDLILSRTIPSETSSWGQVKLLYR